MTGGIAPARRPTANDRSFRSLCALQRTGSTSRVLNLAAIEKDHGDDPGYRSNPLFVSRVLNTCLIVKHRLRADEVHLFGGSRSGATKIIIPFSRTDLSLGGQSTFVGAYNWRQFVKDVSDDTGSLEQDLLVMELIDRLPSLDPFLLRENLRQHGLDVAPCYFAISAADIQRMHAFVATQIRLLINIAMHTARTDQARATARLVEALLSSQVDARLDPLRDTLLLTGDAFREGVFSWKGFLYYKWALSNISGALNEVIDELSRLVIVGPRNFEDQRYFETARDRLRASIIAERHSVVAALRVYDDAFRDLTANGKPTAFRAFLLKAPDMFITLGEKIGGISHIASFWRYRFPKGRPLKADAQEAVDLVRDFEESICVRLD